MPGAPRMGRAFTSAAGDLTDAPVAQVLGEIDPEVLARRIAEELPPPPWEVDPRYAKANMDARQFVGCPEDIELRWVNPRMLEVIGWRDWRSVPAKGDSRFHLKNPSMRGVDNTVRKGGDRGDILAWMYKHWVASRATLKATDVRKRTQGAVDRQESLKEELRRGSFNRVTLDSAHHPTHTIADGRDLRRNDA